MVGIDHRKIFLDDPNRDNRIERLDTKLNETGMPCFS
jgi:hypothetical protein